MSVFDETTDNDKAFTDAFNKWRDEADRVEAAERRARREQVRQAKAPLTQKLDLSCVMYEMARSWSHNKPYAPAPRWLKKKEAKRG